MAMVLSFMIMQLDAILISLKLYKSQPCELFSKFIHAATCLHDLKLHKLMFHILVLFENYMSRGILDLKQPTHNKTRSKN